ncbi:MAG: hypothetical protein LBI08_01680, partial [Methanomassiliicoccaceae archaeon]|nr:hypothetical protein [Methanomassiliicoccaceae archaeon]
MSRAVKTLRLPYSTIRDIACNLEYLNEIRRVPGCRSPILFEDPKAENTPLGVGSRKPLGNAGYVPNGTGGQREERGREDTRVHLNGYVVFEVLNVGTRDRIEDNNGHT